MPRVTCRCGQVLSVPVDGPERVICPKCEARIRVRRAAGGEGDGFIRFPCPCGRRLKVRIASEKADQVQEGKCPDCGRIVPVPFPSSSDDDLNPRVTSPESRTEELDANDLALLDRWSRGHLGAPAEPQAAAAGEPADPDPDPAYAPTGPSPVIASASPVKAEAGLRVCPRCGRPLHLSAVTCRNCGAPVPKR